MLSYCHFHAETMPFYYLCVLFGDGKKCNVHHVPIMSCLTFCLEKKLNICKADRLLVYR